MAKADIELVVVWTLDKTEVIHLENSNKYQTHQEMGHIRVLLNIY